MGVFLAYPLSAIGGRIWRSACGHGGSHARPLRGRAVPAKSPRRGAVALRSWRSPIGVRPVLPRPPPGAPTHPRRPGARPVLARPPLGGRCALRSGRSPGRRKQLARSWLWRLDSAHPRAFLSVRLVSVCCRSGNAMVTLFP